MKHIQKTLRCEPGPQVTGRTAWDVSDAGKGFEKRFVIEILFSLSINTKDKIR